MKTTYEVTMIRENAYTGKRTKEVFKYNTLEEAKESYEYKKYEYWLSIDTIKLVKQTGILKTTLEKN